MKVSRVIITTVVAVVALLTPLCVHCVHAELPPMPALVSNQEVANLVYVMVGSAGGQGFLIGGWSGYKDSVEGPSVLLLRSTRTGARDEYALVFLREPGGSLVVTLSHECVDRIMKGNRRPMEPCFEGPIYFSDSDVREAAGKNLSKGEYARLLNANVLK